MWNNFLGLGSSARYLVLLFGITGIINLRFANWHCMSFSGIICITKEYIGSYILTIYIMPYKDIHYQFANLIFIIQTMPNSKPKVLLILNFLEWKSVGMIVCRVGP